MVIKEVIVVEGKKDTAAVRRAVNADTVETGGSAVESDVLRQIRLAQRRRGVIVLTDPDYEGERIRRIVCDAVSGCKQAFIPLSEANKNGKAGVEYAAPETIRAALKSARAETLDSAPHDLIAWRDIIENGLTAHPDARKRRERLGRALGIGYANARGLYNRLRTFRITREEFNEALAALTEEGRGA